MLSVASVPAVVALLVAVMLMVGLSLPHIRRLLGQAPTDLFSLRSRDNLFERRTSNETRTLTLVAIQLCVVEGLLLLLWLAPQAQASDVVQRLGLVVALMAAWYLFQLTAYALVGYAFTDKRGARSWRRGFNASQALLSLALLIPAIVALFYPEALTAMLILAAGMWLTARIVFVYKGFRIFYTGFFSLLYFILYLCTLEIVPVLAVLATATAICV